MKHTTIYSDVLVLGGGVSGLRAAVAAADKGARTVVVSKGDCASPEIMGFNAPVLPGDSKELYFEDLEKSGYGINDSRLAHVLTDNVLGQVEWLESIGVHFTRDENGMYSPIHTLGTQFPRLIRSGVSSGVTEMRALTKLCGELGVEHHMPVDILGLLKDENRVIGAYGLNRDCESVIYIAKATVLALGGCGALQSFTTYPKAITGDGYAMAYEAGASLVDMEFQQFEPCCFVWPKAIEGKVIATTLLRHGAELRNGDGKTFMENYGLTRTNAQKGALARAMLSEVKAGRGSPHGGIYYDMTMLSPEIIYEDHKIFTKPAVDVGMDFTKEMPEMMPAAHTNLGGVVINGKCQTEVDSLFACGEVIGGLHGGNRLGGCAGAETVVFGAIAGESAAEHALSGSAIDAEIAERCWAQAEKRLDALLSSGNGEVRTAYIKSVLGKCLHENLGIMRDAESIASAGATVKKLRMELCNAQIKSIADAAEFIHCEHMLTLADMQIRASDMRKESRGVFYRSDFPEMDDVNWSKNILIKNNNGSMEISLRSAVKDQIV